MSYSREEINGSMIALGKKGTALNADSLAINIRQNGLEDPTAPLAKDALKREKGAFSILFIEDFWKHVITARRNLRDQGSPVGLGIREMPHSFTLVPPKTPFIEPVNDQLKKTMEQMLQALTIGWYVERNEQLKSPNPDNEFGHYNMLVKTDHEQGASATHAGHLMQQGVGTALHSMWGIVGVIEGVYSEQYGRDISREEIIEIAANSTPLMLQMANTNVEIGATLLEQLSFDHSDRFNPRCLTILGEDKKGTLFSPEFAKRRRLYIKPEVLDAFIMPNGKLLVDHEPASGTTGCLAMYAKVINERGVRLNVISDLWNWTREVAQQYYFPKFRF